MVKQIAIWQSIRHGRQSLAAGGLSKDAAAPEFLHSARKQFRGYQTDAIDKDRELSLKRVCAAQLRIDAARNGIKTQFIVAHRHFAERRALVDEMARYAHDHAADAAEVSPQINDDGVVISVRVNEEIDRWNGGNHPNIESQIADTFPGGGSELIGGHARVHGGQISKLCRKPAFTT